MAYNSVTQKIVAPVDTGDVATALGESSLDIGTLCTSLKIQKWSRNKPERHPTLGILTEDQRKQNFFGFDISEIFNTDAESTLEAAIENRGEYPYLEPIGGESSPFRILDFDGYNHSAERPYKYKQVNNPGDAYNWFDIYMSEKAEILLSEIAPTQIGVDIKNFKIALIYRKKNTTSINVAFAKMEGDYATLSTVDEGESPIIAFNLTDKGEYDCVMAITDASSKDDEDTNWLYLPDAVFKATYNPDFTSFTFGYSDDYGMVGKNSIGRVISDTLTEVYTVKMALGLSGSDALSGNLTVELLEKDGSDYSVISTYSNAWSKSAGGYVSFEHVFNNISSAAGEPYIDKIYVRAELQYKKPTEESYSRRYFNFLTEQLSATRQTPLTLKEIIDEFQW